MGKRQGNWELITVDDFSLEFLHSLTYGQVIGFKQDDGSMQYWKVCRIHSAKGKWWIKPWQLYTPKEFEQMQQYREEIG